jgi:hypothetical protein
MKTTNKEFYRADAMDMFMYSDLKNISITIEE